MQPVELPSHSRGRAPIWYSILFVFAAAAQLLGPVLLLCFVPVRFLQRFDPEPPALKIMGYSLHAPACEIVLYGDSAALTALDPAIIHEKTGLTACNLAEPEFVHWTVGSYFPLDEYIAHHGRPKVIFSYWAANSPHPEPKPFFSLREDGLMYPLIYAHGPYLWKALAMRPEWVLKESIWIEARLFTRALDFISRKGVRDLGPSRDSRAGFWQYPTPAETHCDIPNSANHMTHAQAKAAIDEFRKHYSTGQTKVIVDMAPTADCVANRADLIGRASGLGDNQLEFLPVGNFNDHDVHFTPEASRVLSSQAADQILALMHPSTGSAAPNAVQDSKKGPRPE
jgi:hypothetical protein